MNPQDQLIKNRLDKLQRLRELGIDPYPFRFERSHALGDVQERAETLIGAGTSISVAGRLIALRKQGATTFANLLQDGRRLQIYVNREVLGEAAYQVFKCLDLGDFVGVHGTVFRTNTGEVSVKVERCEVLAKATRPLPVPKVKVEGDQATVFDQFGDVEQRYRQRYLDLVLNEDVAAVFRHRSAIVRTIRAYLERHDYLEVETPTLQPIYGGANARPFITHHNALDMKLYLRVSNELYLKRCIVGGFERVFEFVKDFRNEGIDRTHSPEFTQLEFYQAYADYQDMMVHFETIYAEACIAVNGKPSTVYQGTVLDFTPPWRRLPMLEAIEQYAGLDVETLSDDRLVGLLAEKEVKLQGNYLRGLAIAKLFEAYCEEHLVQPTFVTDHPEETTPLCKHHRTRSNLVERFEPYIHGWEVGNAYSELNDPQIQRRLFEDQERRGRGGEDETHPMDEDFLRSVEYGMPPTGGVGMGIDRMVMLLTDQRTIRDVILFPLLRQD